MLQWKVGLHSVQAAAHTQALVNKEMESFLAGLSV